MISRPFRFASFFVLLLLVSGCATVAPPRPQVGIDGVACVGEVEIVVPGLVETMNPALLQRARAATDKGGVCAARVFAVTAPVTLYRVFDSSRPYSKIGGWWTLERPQASREQYRADNAICAEWSALDRIVACEVRPGTQIVVGTTQSARCSDGTTYPKSATQQVFVANDTRVGIVHTGNCGEEQAWP